MPDEVKRQALQRCFVALYPVLLSMYPVLFLYQHNADEVFLSDAARILGVVGVGTLVVTLTLHAMSRQPERVAVVLAVLTVWIFWYEHLRSVLAGDRGGLLVDIVVGGGLFSAGLALMVFALRGSIGRVRGLNKLVGIFSVCLFVVVFVPAVASATPRFQLDREVSSYVRESLQATSDGASSASERDIYVIVPDRYPAGDTLENLYSFDNSEFLERLRKLGFTIHQDALANYPSTTMSLASTLNMQHLEDFVRHFGGKSELPLQVAIRRSAVARFLTARGYRYHHFGFWWEPTRTSPLADVNHTYFAREFDSLVWRTTLPGSIAARFGEDVAPTFSSWRDEYRSAILRTFEELENVAGSPARTFTFVHLPLPHPPFLFDAHGEPVSEQEELATPRRQNFVAQLRYTNHLLLGWLEALLETSPDELPIIIIQADEGPHPERMLDESDRPAWAELSNRELRQKFAILSAWLLPDVDRGNLDPGDMSPVNSLRTVLNHHFGEELPMAPARSFVPDDGAWPFLDVTDRLVPKGGRD